MSLTAIVTCVVIHRGQHHDDRLRQGWQGPDLLDERKAIHIRHLRIGKDERDRFVISFRLAEDLKRCHRIVRELCSTAPQMQRFRKNAPVCRVVVHNQHG